MSSEALSVLAYNIHDGLGDPERIESIIRLVEDVKPAVAVFSEAFSSHEPGNADDALWELQKLGYSVESKDQEVSDNREDAHALVVIARRELAPELAAVKLSGRFAIHGTLYVPQSDRRAEVFGHHGNDKSEELRMEDTERLIDLFDISEGEIVTPTVVAGDLNRMNGQTTKARALRTLGTAVAPLPAGLPTMKKRESLKEEFKYKVSLVKRLSEMAIGDSLQALERVGLLDVDASAEPTLRKMGLPVTLDYIMKSRQFWTRTHQVLRNLTVDGDTNGRRISDHDAKYAELLLRVT